MQTAQTILLGLYAVLPAAMLGWAVYTRVRHGRSWPLVSLFFTLVTAVALGGGYLMLHRWLFDARISSGESVRLVYFIAGAICLLKVIDRALLVLAFHLARVKVDRFGRPIAPNRVRPVLALLAQRLTLFAIAVPYVCAIIATYRPQLIFDRHRYALREAGATAVSFDSPDGLSLAGAFLPAGDVPDAAEADAAAQWGRQTILLCHGLGSSKEEQIELARYFAENGFNVMVFDFRAHGESGGRFTSFGQRESLDVLAAVRYLRQAHPDQAERILGIGANIGGTALLLAATDAAEGQLIDALVLIEPFANLDSVASANASRVLPRGIDALASRLGVPMASLHAGANLNSLHPIDRIGDVWPRPVLIVHGRGQTFVPTLESMSVFQVAAAPKEQFWPADNYAATRERGRRHQHEGASATFLAELFRQWLGTGAALSGDAGVRARALRFLRSPESSPVI